MKRIILTLIVILISLVSVAQQILQSYALQVGHWNEYTETYNWEKLKSCDIKFILQGDIILANDEAESTYYTYQTITANESSASWNAYDEERRKCIVSLVGGAESYFIVIYNDICYKYFVIL